MIEDFDPEELEGVTLVAPDPYAVLVEYENAESAKALLGRLIRDRTGWWTRTSESSSHSPSSRTAWTAHRNGTGGSELPLCAARGHRASRVVLVGTGALPGKSERAPDGAVVEAAFGLDRHVVRNQAAALFIRKPSARQVEQLKQHMVERGWYLEDDKS
ncbi:hypothetical protein [Streptomyces sp. NPDC020996]|uniref:hypothetical protein n=1 Tax=Streptomyces sp. NPDC020996 TaxID=3154791 RepID=UPI00340AC329